MRDKWFGPLQLSHLALKIWFIYFSIIWLSIFDIYTGWPSSTGLNGCLYKQEQGQIASSETMFPTICETEGGWFNVPYKPVQKKWGRGRRFIAIIREDSNVYRLQMSQQRQHIFLSYFKCCSGLGLEPSVSRKALRYFKTWGQSVG